jgi:hypothetical protein
MSTSTPLLDALRAKNPPNGTKEAIHRNHSHYKDAAQAPWKDDSTTKAAATSGAVSEAKCRLNLTTPLVKRVAKRRRPPVRPVKRPPLRLAHNAAEDRKRICCSTCGQAKSVLSEQGQVRARQQASTHWRTTVHVTKSGRIDGPPSSSSPLTDSGTSTTPAPASPLALASSNGSGRRSRPGIGLASR